MGIMSKVVSLKKVELEKMGYVDFSDWLKASPDHIYIGRDMTKYISGAVGSKWGNPFRGNDWALKYEEHVRSKPELWDSLHELNGKVLGCWCAPEECHGDILCKLVNEKIINNQQK
jgi:hypothetical protein